MFPFDMFLRAVRWPKSKLGDVTGIMLSQLVRSDALLLFPGWEAHEVARLELEFAKANDIIVFDGIRRRAELETKFPVAEAFLEKYAVVELMRTRGHVL